MTSAAKRMLSGCVMVDIEGLELTDLERRRLEKPLCAGVILFARNYRDAGQLRELCHQIRSVRSPSLLIAVDQEGGRVQRFRDGFTLLPPMRRLGNLWDTDRPGAVLAARDVGKVIASELGACGVDFSFAPVLDVDHGCSTVIGDRAFHSDPAAVTELARAMIAGLGDYGMAAVGKHFPGHGGVMADTHHEIAVDSRDYPRIEREDLPPFAALCRGALAGIMPAHVIFEAVDSRPAGFSRVWLQDILRDRLGFDGTVFSDDLSMRAAGIAGDAPARAMAAMDAGCDVVLVCNAPRDADAVLDTLAHSDTRFNPDRVHALRRDSERTGPLPSQPDTEYVRARARLNALGSTGHSEHV